MRTFPLGSSAVNTGTTAAGTTGPQDPETSGPAASAASAARAAAPDCGRRPTAGLAVRSSSSIDVPTRSVCACSAPVSSPWGSMLSACSCTLWAWTDAIPAAL